MKTTKPQVHIRNLADLEREERRVRQRLKTQEAELIQRVKKLPEEALSAALVRLVSVVIEGKILRAVVNFAKKVGKNAFSGFFKDIL
jgi:hypothetical protein